MPTISPQLVQLNCPACGTTFRTSIYTLVDVSQQPELKSALLSGQLNMAICPNCGAATMIGTPLIYHDHARSLFLVYFPQELNARPEEQERFIGEASTFLMRTLPADAPRSYLLTPQRFMSLASLLDAVLQADGIPREVLEKQRRYIDLISQFASALENEQQLARLVTQHKGELTYEFFAGLSAFIEASQQEGRDDAAQMFQQLRAKLIELSGFNAEADTEANVDRQAVLERLMTATDEELDEAITDLRPALDYSFFQAWTTRIEELEQAGQSDQAQRLTARRTYILETVERLDREAQAMVDAGAELLRQILTAPDPQAALQEAADKIDEAFMLVLSANIAQAQRDGQTDLVTRLEQIAEMAMEIIQAQLTPEERFINELLMAETPQESTRLLRTNAAKVTSDLVKKLNEMADEQEKRARKEVSERLRQMAREAGAMLF